MCVGVSTFNIYLVSVVFRTLPTNVGYAIWVSAGIVGTAIGAYFLYSERLSMTQIGFMALIIVGIVGLKLTKA